MKKAEVIQKILDKKKAHKYLEIGVEFGYNFFPIKVRYKTAVDPNFQFPKERRKKWAFRKKHPLVIKTNFYELSSDSYFASLKNDRKFDVVFIDGLHTYEQSLKDVQHSLKHLKDDGVIVMHDCNPSNEAAAYPADSYEHAISLNLPGWTDEWAGETWKTICYLRSNRKDLNIFVLDCDYGLGIITKRKANNSLILSDKDIDKMSYVEFLQNKNELLNLKDENFFFEFLKTL